MAKPINQHGGQASEENSTSVSPSHPIPSSLRAPTFTPPRWDTREGQSPCSPVDASWTLSLLNERLKGEVRNSERRKGGRSATGIHDRQQQSREVSANLGASPAQLRKLCQMSELGTGSTCLEMTPNVQATRKTDKLNFIKVLKCCVKRNTIETWHSGTHL